MTTRDDRFAEKLVQAGVDLEVLRRRCRQLEKENDDLSEALHASQQERATLWTELLIRRSQVEKLISVMRLDGWEANAIADIVRNASTQATPPYAVDTGSSE